MTNVMSYKLNTGNHNQSEFVNNYFVEYKSLKLKNHKP